jgi:N-succinyldiaminopimelate aminotransferase
MSDSSTSIFTTMTALAERTGAINLGQGFPDTDGPAEVIQAAADALRAGHNQYASLPGIPALRRAIAEHQARHYGLALDAESQVQVTFGATEGLASALLALVKPGDEVLVLDPSYDSYGPIIRLAGGVARTIALEPPDWRVESEALRAGVSPATKMLLLNSPHNPTGRVFDAQELALLAGVCREHDLIALTDEVYEHLTYGHRHVPLATLPGMWDRTVTVSSLGKSYSLTGWKVGWATGPAGLIAAVRSVKQFLTFAGGTPFQHAAAAALSRHGAAPEQLALTLSERRDRLAEGLTAIGMRVLPSQGSYFLNADAAPIGEHDATALCERLPLDAGVVGIPTSVFSVDPAGPTRSLVRFAFCKRAEVLDQAVERLAAWAARREAPSFTAP